MAGELELFTYGGGAGSSKETEAFTVNESGVLGGLLRWSQKDDSALKEAAMVWPSGGGEHPTDDYHMPVVFNTTQARVVAVSDAGQALGWSQSLGETGRDKWIYTVGGETEYLTQKLGEGWTVTVQDLNNHGIVVGEAPSSGGTRGYYFDIESSTQPVPIPALAGTTTVFVRAVNDDGEVVGECASAAGAHGFLYHIASETLTDLGPVERVDDINEVGQIAGTVRVPGFGGTLSKITKRRAAVYDRNLSDPHFAALPLPAGISETQASAINNHGHVVGNRGPVAEGSQVCFWFDGDSTWSLTELADDLPSDFRFLHATDINDSGRIAGTSWLPSESYPDGGRRAYLLAAPDRYRDIPGRLGGIAGFLQIFGGVSVGGSGFGVGGGGEGQPIKPPPDDWWYRLPREMRDVLIGLLVHEVGAQVSKSANRKKLQALGLDLIEKSAAGLRKRLR